MPIVIELVRLYSCFRFMVIVPVGELLLVLFEYFVGDWYVRIDDVVHVMFSNRSGCIVVGTCVVRP